jgi:dephospho-CoA kinase
MITVGLTGNIACGKSTAARYFATLGAKLIDADTILHQLFNPNETVYARVREFFGETILDTTGRINRQKLGEIIFHDPEKRHWLNQLTHPVIMSRVHETISRHAQAGAAVVMVEAALLIEAGFADQFDCLVVVSADIETQLRRLKERNGLNRAEALARISAQMPIQIKEKRADWVIKNSGSTAELEAQTQAVWQAICKNVAA